jgi:hypothetical protein
MDWVSDEWDTYFMWCNSLREPWGFLFFAAPILLAVLTVCLLLSAALHMLGIPYAYPVRIMQ